MSNKIDTVVRIERVLYPREYKNGDWCILSVWDIKGKRPLTIKGEVFDLQYRTTYRLIGEYEKNEKYGEQYNILMLIPYTEIETKEDVKRFFSYFLSDNVIDNLFEAFEDPMQIIKEENVSELCKVKGIGDYTANRIIEKYKENEVYAEAYIELGKYGLTLGMIKKIMLKYKNVNTALSKLKTNPYELVDIRYVGWVKADEVAQQMGFDLMSLERLCGFIKHHFHEQAMMGNSWLTIKQLTDAIFQMYGKSGVVMSSNNRQEVLGLISDAFASLKDNNIIYWDDSKSFICLTKYYNLEAKVANELLRLINAKSNFRKEDIVDVVLSIEQEKGYTLTNDQLGAIKLAFDNNVVIISGFSGTGKSTSVQGILKVFKSHSFAQCALSGKASSNLREITGEDGQTIHRLLGYQPKMGFTYNKDNKLPYDIIVLDEISMVGGELFLALLEAMRDGSKLIMLGDHHQLPSIGVMNLLQDMLHNNFIPKKILTEIHRQAQRSAIITESMKVKDGIQIANSTGLSVRGELKDLVLDVYSGRGQVKSIDQITANKIINHFESIYSRVNDINRIQIVVPMRERGESSAFAISNRIQDIYNPSKVGMKFLKLKRFNKELEIRVGDKVINRKNNYKVENTNGEEVSIFNGYIGIVKDINEYRKELIIDFSRYDVGDVIISGEQMNAIELAYAVTCHSFQGSQSDIVIVGLDNYAYMLLSKEWVYTAMTRPRKYCIFVAQKEALGEAISKSSISYKQTFLNRFLGKEVELIGSVEDYYEDEDIFDID